MFFYLCLLVLFQQFLSLSSLSPAFAGVFQPMQLEVGLHFRGEATRGAAWGLCSVLSEGRSSKAVVPELQALDRYLLSDRQQH